MAIFTFSTKEKRPTDEQLIRDVKKHCERHSMSFSGLVVNLLRAYKKESIDE